MSRYLGYVTTHVLQTLPPLKVISKSSRTRRGSEHRPTWILGKQDQHIMNEDVNKQIYSHFLQPSLYQKLETPRPEELRSLVSNIVNLLLHGL